MMEKQFTGTTNTEVQDYEVLHREVARVAAREGFVLLKNEEQVLPLPQGAKIALYGAGAGRTVKGGLGSGDVNERYSVSIYEGLKNAGVEITTEAWMNDYDLKYTKAREDWRQIIWDKASETGDPMQLFIAYSETPFMIPVGSMPEGTETDTAIYVISRNAGEGADRYSKEGDYYLTAEEKQEIDVICKLYDKVILIVNTGGLVDLSFVDEYANIKSILYIVQPGCEAGNAVADVLLGKVSPSGKMTDTWAMSYEEYPNAKTFSHNNGNVETELYEEGIFVGYRYFDSYEIPVRYGFGFGLSYTQFEMKTLGIETFTKEKESAKVKVDVLVTNTGNYAGKEVVQVYASCPQEKLPKEYRRLVGFKKTKELLPGESESVQIEIPVSTFTSFDESVSGWMLVSGVYGIFVGNSLNDSVLSASVKVDEDWIMTSTQSICPLQKELKEIEAPVEKLGARRESWLKEIETLPGTIISVKELETEIVVYEKVDHNIAEDVKKFVDSLELEQLVLLATGDMGQGMDVALGSAGINVPGSAAQTSSCAKKLGLPGMVLADGPAGLRLTKSYTVKDGEIVPQPFEMSLEGGFLSKATKEVDGDKYYQYCTAFPVGTLLAQTWNPEINYNVGVAVADEMKRFQVTLWLAPGMNIHRNPLCGRNFEYYSEDPFLSGKTAAAITSGVQSVHGCGTTIKHFACNNQEDNRMGSDSVISERTLREIYLRGFEIAVKESKPLALMTSYNKINGVHAANNYDLCTKVLRNEWGFDGLIMTDWTTTHNNPNCTASGCMRAGNDSVMPGIPADHENIRHELEAGTLSMEELKQSICHLVATVWKTS